MSSGDTPVYRAVLLEELHDLERLGRFRNPYGIEVKYFALTREGAVRYAALASSAFGEGPYFLVAASLPDRFIGWRVQAVVDQGIEALALSTLHLAELRNIESLGQL